MEKSFESAMTRLEEIAAELESGSRSLEESMKLFEEGTQLLRCCNEQLASAEQKIVKLTDGEVGE